MRRVLLALAAVETIALAATLVFGGDALEPYRALARGADRDRLTAFAREEIVRALEPAPADSDSAPANASAGSVAPDWPGPPCGVYLSLARGTSTRACVGSLTPLGPTLAATVRELARRVVASDTRHPPLRRDELAALRVVLSFAGPPEPVADPMQVAPAREGLLVAGPAGSIAFLPGEARTVAWALREARRVGLLGRREEASYQRFSVVSLQESRR